VEFSIWKRRPSLFERECLVYLEKAATRDRWSSLFERECLVHLEKAATRDRWGGFD